MTDKAMQPVRRLVGLLVGPVLFLLILLQPVPESFLQFSAVSAPDQAAQLARSMHIVSALLVLMVVWWLTEAIPLAATALLPAAVIPWWGIAGVNGGTVSDFTLKTIGSHYTHPVIFLFLGGFLLAGAMQKWGLDRRFTLWFLTRGTIAGDTRKILLGMMCVTAFLSMWISNTASAAIMLPLGLGVLSLIDGEKGGGKRFATAMMLGIAWSASIGGVGTIIGTPPNGIALGILNTKMAGDPSFQRITFLDWMSFGVPYVVLFIPVAWFVLLRLFPPAVRAIAGGKELLLRERLSLGPMSIGARRTLLVFGGAVVLWVSNPFWEQVFSPAAFERLRWVDEYVIGLCCGVALFLIPVSIRQGEFILSWEDSRCVDWGTLILFGGGIALSDAMFRTGLAPWIAHTCTSAFGIPSGMVLIAVTILFVDLLTEVTSNTAVTSMIVPIVISIGVDMGMNPVTVVVAAALAASMAFMLPVATPPNALVFGSGHVKLGDMIKAGAILDIVGWVFTFVIIVIVGNWILGRLPL